MRPKTESVTQVVPSATFRVLQIAATQIPIESYTQVVICIQHRSECRQIVSFPGYHEASAKPINGPPSRPRAPNPLWVESDFQSPAQVQWLYLQAQSPSFVSWVLRRSGCHPKMTRYQHYSVRRGPDKINVLKEVFKFLVVCRLFRWFKLELKLAMLSMQPWKLALRS